MEQSFARKGILENKKRFAITFAVLVLCAFLLQFCSFLRDSLAETIAQNRFDSYGEFTYFLSVGVGENKATQLEQNERVHSFGTLAQLGTAEVDIGLADAAALSLGRIRLHAGRMPEAEDEIALEPAVLLAHGRPAEPGQKITLEVEGLLLPESLNEPPVVQVEFTVSGILHEYTPLWGFGLGGLVAEQGADRLESILGNHNRSYTYLMDAVSYPDIRGSQRNEKAYPKEDMENAATLLGYAIWVIAAVCAMILLVCMLFSVLKRRETWRFFRDLGAEKGQVQAIILWEGLYLGAAGLPLGSVLGIAAAWGLMAAAPSPAGAHWSMDFSAMHAALMLGVAVFCTAVGVVLPSFLVRGTPLLAGSGKGRQKKYKRRKGGLGYMTALRLAGERMRAQRGVTAVLFLTVFSCGLLGAFVIHTVSYHIGEIARAQRLAQNGEIIIDRAVDRINGMYDYNLDILGRMYTSKVVGPLGPDTVEALSQLYGVQDVQRFKIKLSDYNAQEPQLRLRDNDYHQGSPEGERRYEAWEYVCNSASNAYGGISPLLYADLSPFENTSYFKAYICSEQARAAYQLASGNEIIHSVDMNFGRSMSYSYTGEAGSVLQWDDMVPDSKYSLATIWGVDGKPAQPILQAAEGEVDLDAYSRGEECVLVLPDIYFEPNEKAPDPKYPSGVRLGLETMDWIKKNHTEDIGFYSRLKTALFHDEAGLRGYEVFREELIQPGDEITIAYLDGTVSVRVGAILRRLPSHAAGYPYSTLGPYTIITGEDFFQHIEGFTCPESYECVTVSLTGEQPSGVVEMQIKQLLKPLENEMLVVSNLDSTRQGLEQDAWASVSALAVFGVLYLAAALVVLSIIFSISMEGSRRRIAVLRALGLETACIRMSYLLESVCYSVVGFTAALPVMLTAWGLAQANTYGTAGPWLSYVLSEGCMGFLWQAYGLLFLAVTGGVVCTLYMPLRRFFKESIVEQMQL